MILEKDRQQLIDTLELAIGCIRDGSAIGMMLSVIRAGDTSRSAGGQMADLLAENVCMQHHLIRLAQGNVTVSESLAEVAPE